MHTRLDDEIYNNLPSKEYFRFVSNARDLLNKSTHTQRIEASIKSSIDQWVNSYNLIRGKDWPDCDNFDEFAQLPDYIQTECTEIHNFNPIIWANNIKENTHLETHDTMPTNFDIRRIKQVVVDNLEFIKNKHIVDLSCGYGYIAATCLHHRCASITATDIRQSNIDIVNQSITKFGLTNITTKIADIHNYDYNTELCIGVDTVLLCGIMYHVHDHYAILESIAKAGPECIIIETDENVNIEDIPMPLIHFESESTIHAVNGWEQDKDTVLVGYPNTTWFDLSATLLGYIKIKSTRNKLYRVGREGVSRSTHVLIKKH